MEPDSAEAAPAGAQKRKTHPLAPRIKRLMQTDEDVGKIAQATPHLIGTSKARPPHPSPVTPSSSRSVTIAEGQLTFGGSRCRGSRRLLCAASARLHVAQQQRPENLFAHHNSCRESFPEHHTGAPQSYQGLTCVGTSAAMATEKFLAHVAGGAMQIAESRNAKTLQPAHMCALRDLFPVCESEWLGLVGGLSRW